MKENLDIDLDQIQEEQIKIDSNNNANVDLINDIKNTTTYKPSRLEELKIPNEILEAIYFHKGVIMSELKNADKRNTGILKKYEALSAFIRANVHPQLTSQIINQIYNLYATDSENLDYVKVMNSFLRSIKEIIDNDKNKPMNHLSNFNNTSRPTSSYSLKSSMNNLLNSNNIIYNKKVQLADVQRELKTIKIVSQKIITKNSTRLDQNISLNELSNILREFSIVFPEVKLNKIINFLEIPNGKAFTLNDFFTRLQMCKILSSEMTSDDIIAAYEQLRDVIYSLGGRSVLFPNNSQSINQQRFIQTFLNKTNFSEEVLESIYNYITKMDRDLTLDDYIKYFEENKKNNLDEHFEIKAIKQINDRIHRNSLKHDEYFNHLLSYKKNMSDNTLNRIDFHKALTAENFPFSAEEIDYLFKSFDKKKDNLIDREEFNTTLFKVYKALYRIQDIIKKNNLEIEDLLYRMGIEANKKEKFDFFKFKAKMKLLDSTYDHDFIKSLYDEMRGDKSFIDTDTLISNFNVFKKEHFRDTNDESFKLNFIENIKANTSYSQLKSYLEKIDSLNNGLLTKVDFCSIIHKVTKDYRDEDIMKFIRITSLFGGDNNKNNLHDITYSSNSKVKYPEFLNLIFYNSQDDKFNLYTEFLKNYLNKECNKDLELLISKITGEEYVKTIGKVFIPKSHKGISIDQMYNFIKKNQNLEVNKNVLNKFDLDSDGKISIDDLKGILSRYSTAPFFKYENSEKILEVNMYAEEKLTDEKFKQIVRDIKLALKAKNLTEIGLFNKLDSNKDGFVSHPEFNKNIDNVITLAPSIKDQFFNYLDVRQLGLVDLDTFLKRFKEFQSNEIIVKNNWDIESIILQELIAYVKKNNKITSNELFTSMDFDCDGLIGLADFKRVLKEKLNFSQNDLNDYKIERAIQQISLTKDKNIGLADFIEFVNRKKEESDNTSTRVSLTSTNSNLNKQLKNKNWITETIEKLGLYITENFESIDSFFTEYSLTERGKMRIEEFQKFIDKHFKCFEGFNLTSDEVITLFSSLDSHKKSYVTIEDLKNKLSTYNFYRKMHKDVKDAIKNNFKNGIDAFKFFKKLENINESESQSDTFLTKKEIFDGISELFPNKYKTETLLKYLQKTFKNVEATSFSEFNFIFYEDVKNDDVLLNSFKAKTILTSRIKSGKLTKSGVLDSVNESNGFTGLNSNTTRAKSAYNRIFSSRTPAVKTPFDDDPLEKIKRIIHSSRFDYTNFFKMYEIICDNGHLNQHEFRNMIKKLNIGLTSMEIDQIIARAGKTRDGRINLKEFVKYISTEY